jgi:hypothetical protein
MLAWASTLSARKGRGGSRVGAGAGGDAERGVGIDQSPRYSAAAAHEMDMQSNLRSLHRMACHSSTLQLLARVVRNQSLRHSSINRHVYANSQQSFDLACAKYSGRRPEECSGAEAMGFGWQRN